MLTNQIQTQQLISALIGKFCHDLIGPLGTAQMAAESGQEEIMNNCIHDAITKLEIFRSIFNQNIKLDNASVVFNNYIKNAKLNIVIKSSISHAILTLLFFFSQKMISSSTIIFENDCLTLNNVFLSKDEQNALSGNVFDINASNVFPYLAYLSFSQEYTTTMKELEHKNWVFTLEKTAKH